MGHKGNSLSYWSLEGDYKFREPFRGQQELLLRHVCGQAWSRVLIGLMALGYNLFLGFRGCNTPGVLAKTAKVHMSCRLNSLKVCFFLRIL